jgi:hypothetical protein
MRHLRLSVCLALAVSAFSFSAANALPLNCAVNVAAHNHARIVLHGKTLAQCQSGAAGCKCVSCYDLSGAVYSACYPLFVVGILH